MGRKNDNDDLKIHRTGAFKKVYITGLVRDEHGQKMSKSKGNILDPIDLIDGISLEALTSKRTADLMQPQLKQKIERHTRESFPNGIAGFGTDALRFTFYSLASTGRDIKFDLGRTEGFRNFCNKIWNAARYVLMNSEEKQLANSLDSKNLSISDRWIISRFERAIKQVDLAMESYRFDLASQQLYEFIWNEYCDWYVELSKPTLWDEEKNPENAQATRFVLIFILEKTLRLLHPFMPFITEEVWQKIAPLISINGQSIMMESYPTYDRKNIDEEAEEHIEWLKGVILSIRNIRGEMDISPAKSINILLRNGSPTDKERMEIHKPYLQKLAKLRDISWLEDGHEAPVSATQRFDELEILVPLEGLIDVDAERSRLKKEINKLLSGLKAVETKLNNKKFVNNAPSSIVVKEREKKNQISSTLESFETQLKNLEGLH